MEIGRLFLYVFKNVGLISMDYDMRFFYVKFARCFSWKLRHFSTLSTFGWIYDSAFPSALMPLHYIVSMSQNGRCHY